MIPFSSDNKCTGLLEKTGNREYPTDYLLSRLRARRAALIKDYHLIASSNPPLDLLPSQYAKFFDGQSADGVWESLMKDLRWVYFQMNSRLQGIFRPLFFCYELRTIFICLRYRAANKNEEMERALSLSLLSDGLKDIMRSGDNISSVVEGLENTLEVLSEGFRGLAAIFAEKGHREAERALMNAYLEHIVAANIHPVMDFFFSYIIDMRNVVALYKHLRWDIKSPPPFVHGGSIGEMKFKETLDKRMMPDIGPLIYKLTGAGIKHLNGTAIENTLLRGLTGQLRARGKDPLDIGLIIDYLWRRYLVARNLSTIIYGKGLGREAVYDGIIQ